MAHCVTVNEIAGVVAEHSPNEMMMPNDARFATKELSIMRARTYSHTIPCDHFCMINGFPLYSETLSTDICVMIESCSVST